MRLDALDPEATREVVLQKVRVHVRSSIFPTHCCERMEFSDPFELVQAQLLQKRLELGPLWEISWND